MRAGALEGPGLERAGRQVVTLRPAYAPACLFGDRSPIPSPAAFPVAVRADVMARARALACQGGLAARLGACGAVTGNRCRGATWATWVPGPR